MSGLAFRVSILEKNNHTLAIALIIAIAISLCLAGAVFKTINRPAAMVYVNDANVPLFLASKDFELTEEMLSSFVRIVVNNYLTFGPDTLAKQIHDIKVYLGDVPKKTALEAYSKNKQRLISNNVFQQFSIEDISIVKKSSPFIVKVVGSKTLLAKDKSKVFGAEYTITINKITPTKDNPFGLIVESINESEGGKQ
ncbi:MAG: hypothetical protein GY858_08830 [Candidatus Omnitrophica bacterium]|nr:hypothetical protein [Candidatus Omnitrophota bacterium]